MAHDDDVVDVQFVDGNHEAADDAVKVFKSRIAGDFDEFGFAPGDAHGRFEEIQEARVHTGQDGQVAARILADFIEAALGQGLFDKRLIGFQYLPCQFTHSGLLMLSQRP